MSKKNNPLRLNIGFIINESVGYSRAFDFDLPQIDLEKERTASNLKGTIRFDRTQRGILVTGTFTSGTENQCVRCLDDYTQTLQTEFTELYAFDDRTTTDSDLIVPEDGFIDLTPIVREYLLLDFPIKPLCKPDCAGLCPVCGKNHNQETCDCDTSSIDPRLAKRWPN